MKAYTLFESTQDRDSISYVEIKDANRAAHTAREALKRSIKAMRVYQTGKAAIEGQIQIDWNTYRDTVNKSRKLTNKYIKQFGR